MKVVFFCGGLGTRLREYTSTLPKPMVPIGEQPILWHLMKYYGHFGHREFILCLGYKGNLIKQYFIDLMQSMPDDCRLLQSENHVHFSNGDGTDWKIHFADTGSDSNIGQRLSAVQGYLEEDEMFLANYSDGLSDLHLADYLDHFQQENKIASFVRVRPHNSFHTVEVGSDDLVHDIRPASRSEFWINGGFFAFKREIFNYLHDGEELVEEPFKRLIANKELLSYPHEGFWACMDTLKDKIEFDDMDAQGHRPWQLWDLP